MPDQDLSGYFVLGGPTQNSAPLPSFEDVYSGNHIGAKGRGNWVIDTAMESKELNIPARDKRVVLIGSDLDQFAAEIGEIDSSYVDKTYRNKLVEVQKKLPPTFTGVVNNINVDTHGSLGIITNQSMHFMGFHDTRLNVSYLMWSTGEEHYRQVLEADPLRYLIYRMPTLFEYSVFLQSEAVCSKWWRWIKTHNSILHAFNALERRMFGEP